jgi:hypothetical protein
MGWLRNRVERAPEAAWEGPFAPPAPTGRATFNPMVKTAAELTGQHDAVAAEPPVATPAAASAAA